jgi:hypothetical protein
MTANSSPRHSLRSDHGVFSAGLYKLKELPENTKVNVINVDSDGFEVIKSIPRLTRNALSIPS